MGVRMDDEACLRLLASLNAQTNSIEARLLSTVANTPLHLAEEDDLPERHKSHANDKPRPGAQGEGEGEELRASLRQLQAVARRADDAPRAALALEAPDDTEELGHALRRLSALSQHADALGGWLRANREEEEEEEELPRRPDVRAAPNALACELHCLPART